MTNFIFNIFSQSLGGPSPPPLATPASVIFYLCWIQMRVLFCFDFFHGIKTNSNHVLQPYLPDKTDIPYRLRARSHNMTLINKTKFLSDADFLIRMLYTNIHTKFFLRPMNCITEHIPYYSSRFYRVLTVFCMVASDNLY